jgi:hypothetical protein
MNNEEKVSKLVLGRENNGRDSCYSKRGEYNEFGVGTRLLIGFLCLQALTIGGEQLARVGYKRDKQYGRHAL